MPRFLTKKELVENQYSIDKNYHEQMSISEISRSESESDYYERSHRVTTAILKQHENDLITQIQQGQTSVQDQLHVLFIGSHHCHVLDVKVSVVYFSTRPNTGNMYAKIMRRKISFGSYWFNFSSY